MTNNDKDRNSWTDIETELLDYLLMEDLPITGTEESATWEGKIPPRTEGAERIASFAQQRLWFIDQLNTDTWAYNVPLIVQLRGPLNEQILRTSLDAIVARHETLRTVFTMQAEKLIANITPSTQIGFSSVDLSTMSPVTGQAHARKIIRDEMSQRFDLAHGPLLRSKLLRMATDDHIFILIIHHIACDGWSMQILASELVALYDAFTAGQPSPLPHLPIQYADYADWQRKQLQNGLQETEMSYWHNQLTGVPEEFEFPRDHPHPLVPSDRGAAKPFTLSRELSDQLRAITQQEKTTLFMTLLAAFQSLLGRYSRSNDFLIGTPIAGRTHAELEGLIGFFVNTLVLRANLSGDPSFRELLGRVRETVLDAFTHQELPFEKLVEEIHPTRTGGMSTLIQVVFTFDQAPASIVTASGITLDILNQDVETVTFDLILRMWDDPNGIAGRFEYSTDLFQTQTINWMTEHFQMLLKEFLTYPNRPLSQCTMLTTSEKEQILISWNATKASYLDKCGIHELVESQVTRTPDAIAVVGENGLHLSYFTLNTQANQLAQQLHHQGICPGTLVGIYLQRSAAMSIAVLAVLKAGGGYVALDPTYPEARISLMLNDANVHLVITNPHMASRVPQGFAQLLFQPEDDEAIEEENLGIAIGPEDPCYIIYTSGSTGQPKGISLPHRVLTNLISWHTTTLGRGMRTSQHSSFSFDNSVHEMFVAWTSGGTLVIVPDDVRADPVALAYFLDKEALEKVILPAILLHHIAEAYSIGHYRPLHLKEMITSGEQLVITPVVRELFEHLPDCRLHNHYGPSETHVVTAYALPSDPATWPTYPPIGRPIANTQAYVTDPHGQPVPVGQTGELFIGGANIAHGYLGQCERTAERFMPDPFGREPGARLYRTGDLARYLPTGDIEFLGRIDHQIKIRGYRVEPGEVETILYQHPAVREAVVLANDDTSGGKRLVAYVVPEHNHAQMVDGHQRFVLPNRFAMTYVTRSEVEAIYQEIFEDLVHTPADITIADGDCIIDVGANIGLFTLFASQQGKQVRLYAIEPAPAVCECLRINVKLYGIDAEIIEAGLSASEGSALFTYYPRATCWSGFDANAEEDERTFSTSVQNEYEGEVLDHLEDFLAGRFEGETFPQRLITLSQLLRDHQINQVDLLKIDVEKSEMKVLLGIEECDWPKIRQITIEVHDHDGRLQQVYELLEHHGFAVRIEQERILAETNIYHVYGTCPSNNSHKHRSSFARLTTQNAPALLTIEELRQFLSERVPTYLIPAAFILLESLPLTANGKVNKQALLRYKTDRPVLETSYELPRTSTEQTLATLWAEMLELNSIGIHDNYFDLGGYSLSAMRLISRIRDLFQVDLIVRDLFQAPTIARLAEVIDLALIITLRSKKQHEEDSTAREIIDF